MSTNSKTAKALLLAGTAGLSCAVLLAAAAAVGVAPARGGKSVDCTKDRSALRQVSHGEPPALNSYGKSYKSKAK